MPLEDSTLGTALLTPTRIYVKSVLALLDVVSVKAMAHITGGGLTENIPRVLPVGTRAVLETSAWPRPAIFEWLAGSAGLDQAELRRTFNCGIGLVICVDETQVDDARRCLEAHGERVWLVGGVEAGDDSGPRVVYR
jgi:phosphoribosylformylglycinamidine cyclo-ligase